MKVFLTGGTGFIGKHYLALATSSSNVITALRRNSSAGGDFSAADPIWFTKAMDEVEVADLKGHDVLVHLASAGVSPQNASLKDMVYWNVSVLMDLLEKATQANIKRVVLAGSFAEYGQSSDLYDFIPVDAPLRPTYAYAASKAAAYVLATTFAIDSKIELCYLRIFSAYGEGQFEGNFWPALRNAAEKGLDFPMTHGEQVRDYIPVEQVALAIEHAVARSDIVPGMPMVMNVGSGVPVSMLEFARHWWSNWNATGKLLVGAIPYRKNEIMRCVPKI